MLFPQLFVVFLCVTWAFAGNSPTPSLQRRGLSGSSVSAALEELAGTRRVAQAAERSSPSTARLGSSGHPTGHGSAPTSPQFGHEFNEHDQHLLSSFLHSPQRSGSHVASHTPPSSPLQQLTAEDQEFLRSVLHPESPSSSQRGTSGKGDRHDTSTSANSAHSEPSVSTSLTPESSTALLEHHWSEEDANLIHSLLHDSPRSPSPARANAKTQPASGRAEPSTTRSILREVPKGLPRGKLDKSNPSYWTLPKDRTVSISTAYNRLKEGRALRMSEDVLRPWQELVNESRVPNPKRRRPEDMTNIPPGQYSRYALSTLLAEKPRVSEANLPAIERIIAQKATKEGFEEVPQTLKEWQAAREKMGVPKRAPQRKYVEGPPALHTLLARKKQLQAAGQDVSDIDAQILATAKKYDPDATLPTSANKFFVGLRNKQIFGRPSKAAKLPPLVKPQVMRQKPSEEVEQLARQPMQTLYKQRAAAKQQQQDTSVIEAALVRKANLEGLAEAPADIETYYAWKRKVRQHIRPVDYSKRSVLKLYTDRDVLRATGRDTTAVDAAIKKLTEGKSSGSGAPSVGPSSAP
ncbi:hypothetical protein IE81DRAFT_69522 [Ceraceosorus guamensis]|uniref:Uncharacterized protein n=1 Tax=Ceraceosorus guamensis TaxID=1522189 RepID=A0A316VRQ1_9BASI|nr:hypothetical protein IE81DRAFT_69522 [Ceraceosorus guamensis]PWN38861.1 hypothetical protein IE81DRAFT_69522 [Ceraceosorus guamensis]